MFFGGRGTPQENPADISEKGTQLEKFQNKTVSLVITLLFVWGGGGYPQIILISTVSSHTAYTLTTKAKFYNVTSHSQKTRLS